MRPSRDRGEPISRGRQDRRSAERRALGDALFFAALFGGVVLVNGILAALLIEFLQAMGWWEVRAAETSHGPIELSRRWRPGLAAAGVAA